MFECGSSGMRVLRVRFASAQGLAYPGAAMSDRPHASRPETPKVRPELSPEVARVLDFWFASLDERGLAPVDQRKRWFQKSEDFDREVSREFQELHTHICAGRRDDWLALPHSRLAYILVIDQFSRNMFRGDPKTYAHDDLALDACKTGIESGMMDVLVAHEQAFFLMPLMHSEGLADQELCVEKFAALMQANSSPVRETFANNHQYAIAHSDIVARFGRFPHRNALLGRESTPEELAFLATPNSSF